jgi:sn-glycerol 3-phosphate transport system ATP-binding protein
MATVSLKDVKKSFGVTDVIQGISTDIADGEFIVIVGPSGCGKSTLLRMIAGLETVSAGEVFIGGDLVNEKEPMDRDIAMVFQNYALYPHMTVRQNMGYGLKIAKMPKEQIDAKVVEAAKLLQLEPLPNNCQADNASELQWAVRSCANQQYFYLMNPSRTLMLNLGSKCDWKSANYKKSLE